MRGTSCETVHTQRRESGVAISPSSNAALVLLAFYSSRDRLFGLLAPSRQCSALLAWLPARNSYFQIMTTAHRPTWAPAKGGEEQGGTRIFAPIRQYSAKDAPSHTTLKLRQVY